MAHEMICGKGKIKINNIEEYNYLVDLWSVGICLFEFMCGMCPYGGILI
jgi:cGMP-dependent protein kinase